MKRFCLILVGMLFLLTGCGEPNATIGETVAPMEETVVFVDDLGREVAVAPPTRVAALIGSFADIWCLAGGRDTLVAESYSMLPSFWRSSLAMDYFSSFPKRALTSARALAMR